VVPLCIPSSIHLISICTVPVLPPAESLWPLFPLKIPSTCVGIWTPSNTWFLAPTWVHFPNGISIGSVIFAQLTAECRYTLQWAAPFRLKIVPSLMDVCTPLNPQPKWHLVLFSYFCRAHDCDRWRNSACNSRLHLHSSKMRPSNRADWCQKWMTDCDGLAWWHWCSGYRRSSQERSYTTSGPVSTGMGDRLWAGIPSWYLTSQVGQLSLVSLRGRSIEYRLRLG